MSEHQYEHNYVPMQVNCLLRVYDIQRLPSSLIHPDVINVQIVNFRNISEALDSAINQETKRIYRYNARFVYVVVVKFYQCKHRYQFKCYTTTRSLKKCIYVCFVSLFVCLFLCFVCGFTPISSFFVISRWSVVDPPNRLLGDHQFLLKWPTTIVYNST